MNSKINAKNRILIKTIVFTGIMAAMASILRFLEFPLFFIAQDFLKIDFSNLPALIVSFVLGPLYGLAVVAIKNLVYFPATTTA